MKKYIITSVAFSLVFLPSLSGVYAKSSYYTADKDKNGIPDYWQAKYHLGYGKSVAVKDNDKDGLTNLMEYQLNLNPISKDSNHNKISDGSEDYDKDGLTNIQEIKLKTNPKVADTDKNGIKDGDEDKDHDGLTTKEELAIGTNPTLSDTNHNGTPDGLEDQDHDGLSNEMEYQFHTNPLNADTDHDGIKDGKEDNNHDGVVDQNQLMELSIKAINLDGKKLSIHYEYAGGKNKYRVTDEIGVGDVPTLIKSMNITPNSTKDDLANQFNSVFKIENLDKFSIEAEFANGTENQSELENESRIVAMSFCEPRSCRLQLSS